MKTVILLKARKFLEFFRTVLGLFICKNFCNFLPRFLKSFNKMLFALFFQLQNNFKSNIKTVSLTHTFQDTSKNKKPFIR